MSNHQKGVVAEEKALVFLQNLGFVLCKKRYKTKAGEIDLIVGNDVQIVFCEVKMRKTYDDAAFSVTERSQNRIRISAEIWLAENLDHAHKEMRFDCLFVIGDQIYHLENAF